MAAGGAAGAPGVTAGCAVDEMSGGAEGASRRVSSAARPSFRTVAASRGVPEDPAGEVVEGACACIMGWVWSGGAPLPGRRPLIAVCEG